ncbi:MAG: leucine-rich repeat protein [Oscillospiraceae bacterium]|nr:leucine-rich repeat protein [Oscillospiraceae bacterium]
MKKIIAVIFAIAIALSISVYGFAASGEINYENTVTISHEPVIVVNPLYKDIVSEEDIEIDFNKAKPQVSASAYEYSGTYEGAGDQARDYLESRTAEFTVHYKTTNYDGSDERVMEIAGGILNEAMAHTGEPTEGDYINWHWEGYGVLIGGSYSGGVFYLDITFYFTYYTTAEQEAAVGAKINEIFEELDIESKNDYFKIKAIYDYICANVTYDWDNLNNDDYKLQYTAYAALINGTSVCQGYANLFYRMALLAGVDARLVAGIGAGGPHGWNIVQMGDYYYNLDSTWDAGVNPEYYECFLKCPETFVDHYRYVEYETAEFHAAYPMGTSDYVYNESDFEDENIIASGYCGGEGNGQNLEWKLDKDGVLIISGTGKMADYEYLYKDEATDAPWVEYCDSVKVLVIKEGVTSIGDNAFLDCVNLAGKLVLPEGITKIGECAFYALKGLSGELVLPESMITIDSGAFCNCTGFTGNLDIPDKVKTIGNEAFYKCTGFTGTLTIGKSVTDIGEYAFYNCNKFTGGLVIPDSVKILGASAFERCYGFNGNLIIGKGIETIPESAFDDCLKFSGDLVIPDNVKIIGNDAFRNCSGFSGNLVIGSGVTEIGMSAFASCTGFAGKIVLGENVEYICDNAFEYCRKLTGDIIIPDKVVYIGNYAFAGCIGFKGSLVLGKNVVDISHSAFSGCKNLSGNVTLPKTVGFIGEETFKNCGINNYYFEGNAPSLGEKAFDSASDTIYYPRGAENWNIVAGKWNGYKAVEYRISLDINSDASVDIKDVYYLRLVAGKLIVPTAEDIELADVDGDGKLTAIDANILRKYLAGIIKELPAA